MNTENRDSEAGGCAAAGNDGLVVVFERLLLARDDRIPAHPLRLFMD